MTLKFTYNGRFMWHGTMIVDGEECEFACFADDMAKAVATFDTLPDGAEVISLARGEDVGTEPIEVDNSKLEASLEEHRKRQIN